MIKQYLGTHAVAAPGGALFLMLLIACSDSPDTLALEARTLDSSPAMSIVGPARGGVQGVQSLVTEFEAAFVAKDAVAYGAVYAVDADFVNPIGVLTSGRDALVALHTLAFAGPFAGASFTAELHDVQFLTGTIALVDVYTTLWDAGPPPPFAVVSPDGKVRARARWLIQKRAGEWEILVSYHRGWGH